MLSIFFMNALYFCQQINEKLWIHLGCWDKVKSLDARLMVFYIVWVNDFYPPKLVIQTLTLPADGQKGYLVNKTFAESHN